MAEDEFKQFLPEQKLDKDNLSVEIPSEQTPLQYDRIPSGYEPMGEIQLRGRVFSRLASGRVPGWVLITGWILFGSFALIMLYVAIMLSAAAWIFLAITAVPLLILWRGTQARIVSSRRRMR